MKTINLSTASRTLAEYAAELADDIVLLTDRNKPVAALVPLRGVDRESIALSGHPAFLRIIERSRRQFDRGETLSLEEMKARFSGKRSPNKALQPPSRARGRSKSKRRARAARG